MWRSHVVNVIYVVCRLATLFAGVVFIVCFPINVVNCTFYSKKILYFSSKNLHIYIFCCTFTPNIPIKEYGLGCPRLEGLSVLAVLFFLVRYQLYSYLLLIFVINIIFNYIVVNVIYVVCRYSDVGCGFFLAGGTARAEPMR